MFFVVQNTCNSLCIIIQTLTSSETTWNARKTDCNYIKTFLQLLLQIAAVWFYRGGTCPFSSGGCFFCFLWSHSCILYINTIYRRNQTSWIFLVTTERNCLIGWLNGRFLLFVVATGCPSERRPLVLLGDIARTPDKTTESSA